MAQARLQQNFQDRVVHIARVAKVVKGGRRFSFSALVCAGDGISKIGFSIGKANEVPDAIEKASQRSRRNMIDVPIVDGTIPFAVIGKYGSSKVMMYPAPPGKGIIAGSSARIVLVICGIKDIVCKIHGSRNHHNVVRATIQGLSQLQSIDQYAALRNLDAKSVFQHRPGSRDLTKKLAAEDANLSMESADFAQQSLKESKTESKAKELTKKDSKESQGLISDHVSKEAVQDSLRKKADESVSSEASSSDKEVAKDKSQKLEDSDNNKSLTDSKTSSTAEEGSFDDSCGLEAKGDKVKDDKTDDKASK